MPERHKGEDGPDVDGTPAGAAQGDVQVAHLAGRGGQGAGAEGGGGGEGVESEICLCMGGSRQRYVKAVMCAGVGKARA